MEKAKLSRRRYRHPIPRSLHLSSCLVTPCSLALLLSHPISHSLTYFSPFPRPVSACALWLRFSVCRSSCVV